MKVLQLVPSDTGDGEKARVQDLLTKAIADTEEHGAEAAVVIVLHAGDKYAFGWIGGEQGLRLRGAMSAVLHEMHHAEDEKV